LNGISQSNKILRFKTIDDGSEAILTAVAPLRPDSHRSERKCEIVRNNDQPLDRTVIFCDETAYRLAAEIHVRLRLDQLDYSIINFGPADQATAFAALYLRLQPRREQIDEHKAEIVPRLCVFRARVSKPDYQPITHTDWTASVPLANGDCQFSTEIKPDHISVPSAAGKRGRLRSSLIQPLQQGRHQLLQVPHRLRAAVRDRLH